MRLINNRRFPRLRLLQLICTAIQPHLPVCFARVLLLLIPALGLAWPVAASAQLFHGRLIEAVLLTLQHEPNVAAANRQIALSEGQLQTVSGEFDTVLDASVATGQTRVPLITALQAPGRTQVDARTTSYSVGSTTRLRSGVTVAPVLRVDHVRDNFNAVSAPASSQLALNFTLPLLRGRGVEANTAVERAARENLQSAQLAYRHTVAARITASVNAYWDYLAALRALEIRTRSEARSLLLLDDARRLAKGDEIPQADVLQNEAQLARDRGLRLAAEQTVVEARSALAIAMGLRAIDVTQLAPPLDDFPELQPAQLGQLQALPPITPPAGRFDLLASYRRLAAAEILHDAVRKDPVSQLDLTFALGYNGLVENRSAFAAAEALRRPASGFNAYVGMVYVLPVEGNVQAGQVRQRGALADQARIELEALLLSVKAGIAVQRANLSSAVLQLEQQQQQVMLQAQVFANERKKYRLGLATVLDLLTVEARLTSDELVVIDARRRLAQALVGYRFETGTLLSADGDAQRLDMQSLTTVPEPR
jgi:outer membrane protein